MELLIATFTPALVIELGSLLVAVLGIFYVIDQKNITLNVKISENTTKILQLEKEMLVMKQDYDKEMTALKLDFANSVRSIKTDNRNDHGKIFDKLGDVAVEVAGIATALKMHMDHKEK